MVDIRLCRNVLLIFCRLHSTHYAIVKLIGTSLHNLEELFLHHIHVSDLKYENNRDIECLVAGCPKLRILHVDWKSTLESVQYLLLGLPNLIEFKHPLMVLALEKIIQDGKADRVSAIRNLYIATYMYVLESVQKVMNHLYNITKLDITIPPGPSTMSLTAFSVTVSNMTNLTELTLNVYFHNVLPILKTIGHQLKLLDLNCLTLPSLDVIGQCRKLRVLRIKVLGKNAISGIRNFQRYDNDLQEEFTAFQYLQELNLDKLTYFHFKSALIKSLFASPVLRDLTLMAIPIVTDKIIRAVFNHINQDGEQLAFTSLRRLELKHFSNITNYLINVVSHERVPLEVLILYNCSQTVNVTPGLFTVEIIDDDHGHQLMRIIDGLD